MFKFSSPPAASALLSLSLSAAPAWAVSAVTYVSGKGADTGGCATPATACRTFQFAINQAAPAGEIVAIDPANFGPVAISKSISIEGVDGATITGVPKGGSGIAINAGPNGATNISRLTIDGGNAGQSGISTASFGSLTVTHSTVRNFCDGIDIFAMTGKVFLIEDVLVSDNTAIGLDLVGVPGTLDHVTVAQNGAAKCGNSIGIWSIRAAQGAAVVSIVDSTVANNNSALIDSEDGATIRFYGSFLPDGVGLGGGHCPECRQQFYPAGGPDRGRHPLTTVATR